MMSYFVLAYYVSGASYEAWDEAGGIQTPRGGIGIVVIYSAQGLEQDYLDLDSAFPMSW